MITHGIEIDCGREDAREKSNAELVRRYFDVVWNQGDLAAVDDFFGDEFTNSAIEAMMPGGGSSPAMSARRLTSATGRVRSRLRHG